jgi:hypothetical protein
MKEQIVDSVDGICLKTEMGDSVHNPSCIGLCNTLNAVMMKLDDDLTYVLEGLVGDARENVIFRAFDIELEKVYPGRSYLSQQILKTQGTDCV